MTSAGWTVVMFLGFWFVGFLMGVAYAVVWVQVRSARAFRKRLAAARGDGEQA